jgi:hypothetical protein
VETEIGRITVQEQPRQKVHEMPSQPMARCGGMHLPSQLCKEAEIGRIAVLGKKLMRLSSQQKKLSVVVYAHPSHRWKQKQKDCSSPGWPRQK